MNALIHTATGRVAARVNFGRWLADCLHCSGAALLRPGTSVFRCDPGCGALVEVLWPDPELQRSIERLLSLRPQVANRNWQPSETLHDLMFENGAHGIYDHISLEPGELALSVTDGTIRIDRLAELTADPRKAIA